MSRAVNLSGTGIAVGVALLIAAGLVVFAWRYRELMNPASDKNLAYRGAGAVVGAVSGGAETTAGGVLARVREMVSGDDAAIREMLKGAPPLQRTPAKTVIVPAWEFEASP